MEQQALLSLKTRPIAYALWGLLLSSLILATEVQAVPIVWTGVSLDGTGIDAIDTTGTLVEAHNTGQILPTTVAGILFDDTEVDPFGSSFTGATAAGLTGNAAFDLVLNSASFAVADRTLTIDNLTIAADYLVQFFVADTRGFCCSARTVIVDDGEGGILTSGALGVGYAFTGTFTASGTSEDIMFSGVALDLGESVSVPYLNAWQLRQLPGASQVPEPSTLMLMSIGLVGLGWMGRRRQKI